MIETDRPFAQPVVGIEESEVALEKAVYPQAGQLRRLPVLVEVFQIIPAQPDAFWPEIAEVGEADDEQAVKVRVVGVSGEQSSGVGADDRRLDRPDSGQLLETVEIGVEQDPAIADDRDRSEIRQPALLCPGLGAVVDIAGAKADMKVSELKITGQPPAR